MSVNVPAKDAAKTPSTRQQVPAQPKRRALKRFLKHRLAVFGSVTLVILVIVCVFGPRFVPHDPLEIDLRCRFAPPLTDDHLLGCDEVGRDLLARLLVAGRVSLLVGFAAMAVGMTIGIVIGAVSGYYGGWVDTIIMRMVDAVLSFPVIFLLLIWASLVKPNLGMIALIIGVTAWMDVARIVRGEFLSLRERDYTMAAKALGATDRHVIVKELLPNTLAPIVVAATLSVSRAILLESYISFLGYGIQPPVASWGNMLTKAQSYFYSSPWIALFPGFMITLAVTSCNFLGDGLRDTLDPKLDA